MSEYQGDIKKIRAMYDAVAEGIIDDPFKPKALGIQDDMMCAPHIKPIEKCERPKIVDEIDANKEQKMAMFLGNLATSFKKTSEERKYCEKLIKNFEDMNLDSIRFFILSNYDRFDEIHTLAKKYEENFDAKEVLKYEARFAVLSKAMIFMLQENL